MKLGLFAINAGVAAADPVVAISVARLAEECGWESVWTGEHPVLPEPAVPSSPAPGRTPMLDPFITLAAIAATTTTLLLGTGVTVVPLHHPLRLAKQVASLDVLSNGRLLFGVGVGYLEPEFAALGVPLGDRAARTMDYLAAMRSIWNDGAAPYRGTHVSFERVMAEPRPIQRPTPRLHMGGHVPAALRRAVEHGHGWYGFNLGVNAIAEMLRQLRAIETASLRPDHLGRLEISVTPDVRQPLTADDIAAFAELGVDRLVLQPPRDAMRDAETLEAFVRDVPALLRYS